MQGIAVGGEIAGFVTYSYEKAPKKIRALVPASVFCFVSETSKKMDQYLISYVLFCHFPFSFHWFMSSKKYEVAKFFEVQGK